MDKKEIVISMALDNHFVMPIYIVAFSMMKNIRQGMGVRLCFLVTRDFLDENREILKSLEELFPQVNCQFIPMTTWPEDIPAATRNFPLSALFRLALPDLLTETDKCLYLDGDIIVLGDISELFEYDMEAYYLAGVKSPGFHVNVQEDRLKGIGLISSRQYVNSGVLLMNLKKMREDGLGSLMMEMRENPYSCPDQDILNITCFGHIRQLPPKYNAQLVGLSYPDEELEQVFTKEEIREAREAPVIVHFSNALVKPWENFRLKHCDDWWNYYRQTRYGKEEAQLKKRMGELDEQRLLSALVKRINREKRTVIFGYSYIGRNLYDRLFAAGADSFVGFCDNDPEKIGQEYRGLKVWPVAVMGEQPELPFIIIASQKHAEEIRIQLLALNFDAEKLYLYQQTLTRHINRALKPGEKEEYL